MPRRSGDRGLAVCVGSDVRQCVKTLTFKTLRSAAPTIKRQKLFEGLRTVDVHNEEGSVWFHETSSTHQVCFSFLHIFT